MSFAKYLRDPALIAKKARWQAMYWGPQRDVTVDSYNGRLTFDSRDKLIGKTLWMYGAYERDAMDAAMALLEQRGLLAAPPGGTVLDVGANIGMICIPLVQRYGFQRAVAFEPAPGNFRLLAHNVAQNGLAASITPMHCALSSADGDVDLELSGYNSGDHRIRHGANDGAYGEARRATVRVPARTLDAVAAGGDFSAADVRMVWLDIQGHEGQFLEGARGVLRRPIPLATEFWPYGILRSGMTRARFVDVVSELFTHVYVVFGGEPERLRAAAVDALFDRYARPTEACQLLLTRES